MTIPIALLMGGLGRVYPSATGPITVMGVVLLMLTIVGGRVVANSSWAAWFAFDHASLVWMLAGYGFIAAVLPIWLLLIPRDYLSSTMKVAVIALLAVGWW